ncbi:hypothetical protein K7432_016175 [Basidiobolus ranarum]|uniref:Uncharacterized protein n=1 Tax=Basidiobolus ranarum TaxID=34480 RepID=A0ABR2WF70_9FUNG
MQSAEFTRKYVCDNYFKIPIDEVKNFSKVTFDVRKDGGSRYFNAKNFFQPGFFQTGGFGFSPKEFVPNFGFNPRRRRHRNSY